MAEPDKFARAAFKSAPLGGIVVGGGHHLQCDGGSGHQTGEACILADAAVHGALATRPGLQGIENAESANGLTP